MSEGHKEKREREREHHTDEKRENMKQKGWKKSDLCFRVVLRGLLIRGFVVLIKRILSSHWSFYGYGRQETEKIPTMQRENLITVMSADDCSQNNTTHTI